MPGLLNRIFLFSLLFLIPLCGYTPVFGSDLSALNTKKVLLLNSYHKGYLWTDEITRGVHETFQNHGIELHIEYMDTKRQFRFQLLYYLSEVLKIKHRKHRYDLVITSDDNAFNFIKSWRENIFKAVPIVFCGVNYLGEKDVQGLVGYTGINEKMDVKGNIELIKSLHSDARRIIVITDDTTTGRLNQKEVLRTAALVENQAVDIELLYDISMEDLVDRSKSFKSGTVVLFTIFIRDKNDRFLEYEAVLKQVAEAVRVPLYATQNFSAHLPVVGGYITNGYDQGAAAAEKARQILSGQAVSQTPIAWETPTHPRFNYTMLERLGIDERRLPPNSHILFKPPSFYQEHKLIIELTALVFVLLLIAFLGVSYGLIKSKKAEKQISESEKKYRHLFENAPAGMYEMDMVEMKFKNVNQVMCQLTGYPKEELQQLTLLDLLAEESKELYQNRIQQIGSGTPDIATSIEYFMIRKDGQKRCIVLNLDFIRTDAQITSARVVVQDITERKQVEELMVQSEKMLSIGGLAAGMAHEINNPLAGMMQNAQVIYNRLSSDLPANKEAASASGISMDSIRSYMDKRNILEQLQSINDAGARAARIVNNMLSFSRKSDSSKTKHQAAVLMDESVELARSDYNLARKYDFKRIRIVKAYAPNLPGVYCEKSKIEQVLLNILKNSAEAMTMDQQDNEIPELRLSLSLESDFIKMEIADNGPGMGEETRKRIFEPFFTTKTVDQGTGLGLSVSYFIIVDDHKGKMDASSTPGEGSCFTIHLPVNPP